MERGKEWKREEEVMQASVLAPVEVDQMSHRQPDCRGHDAGPRWHKKNKIYFVFTSSSVFVLLNLKNSNVDVSTFLYHLLLQP